MLTLSNVNTYYGKIHILRDVSLTINEGELASVIGANGAGKTTLVRTISGFVVPRSGRLQFGEVEITGLSPQEVVKRGITQVPEGRRLFPLMTVMENLELGTYCRRDSGNIREDYELVFSLFPKLKERSKQSAGTLSGGEQQMAAIGRGLMARPKLLLMDEPTLGLSPILVEALFDVIQRINDQGIAILLIEQNAHMALKVAARAYVLETGRVVLGGPSKELLANEMVRKSFLGR